MRPLKLAVGPPKMDKRALKILNDAYWGPEGWKPKAHRQVSDTDFAYAKSAGLMFDPIRIDHDATIKKCLTIRDQINPMAVANSFIWSLPTRSLMHRSAIGSYAALRHLPNHKWEGHNKFCKICGTYGNKKSKEHDLNVLNFERHKWGGVRHLDLVYASFDLEQFYELEPVEVESQHVALLKELLNAIEDAPVGTTSAKLQQFFPKSLKSNKSERDILIGILGISGILETVEHHGFLDSYVCAKHRELPARRFVDMVYPACWWTRSDGINKKAVDTWFGHLL